MKKSKYRLRVFLLICPFFISWETDGSIIQNQENTKAYHSQIIINSSSKDKQVNFGVGEIIRLSGDRGYKVYTGGSKKMDVSGIITIYIMADSVQTSAAVNKAGLKVPEFSGWQCYSIRKKKEENNLKIWILSTDKSGAMYGCLDIAEAINNQTINNISDSDNRPYLERRGLKFNIPFDLRTPSYSDLSDAFQQNITVMWDMDFWKQQFDEMARNRYNVISLWSLNPFPSLVKVPEFPDVALNDVWRTTAKLENVYPTDGTGNLNQELLENHEIVKKITINEKIDFWRKVMEYARDRGIEVYLFTWNIFTFGENGKYGIDNDRSNDKTIAYFRASVREMVLTYPLLAGFGITAGENMGGKNELYTNEQWLWKTYGEGIRDALQKQPGRKIRLIHRFHQTGLTEIMDEFREYPGIMDLSIKYSIAHMYSITNPPFARGAFELLPSNRHTWLTVRNDDIYSFRWGNPDYARHYLLNIPSPEKVAGYYMGSDGYCLGREFLGKDNAMPRPLVIEKQWYSYMLWGRLSYNPHLSDELFLQTLESRFPAAPGRILMNAWSAASMVFPWTTRLLWGDIDLKWFPEACISIPSYKGFYTVKDFMEVEPMAGSNIQNILDWAQNYKFNKTSNLLSPLAVADSISKYSRLAMIYLHQMMPGDPGSSVEFDQTLGDIEAFATIGFYYKEKILGACSLALFNFYGLQQDKEDAVDHLTKAKEYWAKYAAIYDSKYKPALYNRIGYVNIPLLLEKTVKDIEIASYWKPGSIKEYTVKTRTEVPFSK